MKKCTRCAKEKPLSEFSVRSNGKPKAECLECHREYCSSHYVRNKDYYIQRNAERRAELRKLVEEAKNQPCVDCGVQYEWFQMQFDHLDAEKKLDTISRIANRNSKQKLLDEIAKCEVLCANCHAARTYKRRIELWEQTAVPTKISM